MDCFLNQDGEVCTPEGRTCIEERSNKDFNCTVNCEGIYTDVHIEKTTLRQCEVKCGIKKCDVDCDVQNTNQDGLAVIGKLVSKLMKEYNTVDKKYKAARKQSNVAGIMDSFKGHFDE